MPTKWFTPADIRSLQEVSEGLHWETIGLLRAVDGAYTELVEMPARVFPPGVMKRDLTSLAPYFMRGVQYAAIEVNPALADANAIGAKDRIVVKSQNNRLFEVIAPLTARTIEIRRKLLVHEIQQPERLLYLALAPTGYDSTSDAQALPELIKVLPVPFVVDKNVDTVTESESGGVGMIRLKQFEVHEIALSYFSPANLARLLYCLVVPSDVTPTAQQAADHLFPRYAFNGSASFENHRFASLFPWSVALVEVK